MALLAQQSSSYRVEVSGWDAGHAFFSEKTMLYSRAAEQEIPLRSRLLPGIVIFVRLLRPFETEESFPVPYVVARNLPVEIDGRTNVAVAKPSSQAFMQAINGCARRPPRELRVTATYPKPYESAPQTKILGRARLQPCHKCAE